MKIKTRLVLGFVACGIVPLIIVGSVNYWTANRGMTGIQAEAQQDSRDDELHCAHLVRTKTCTA